MAETANLQLKTYDSPATNENPVDIENNWNTNWEKVDEAYGNLNKNKVEKEDGKGLSTNDFTNADKEKLDGLNNYDDTEIKEEISDIQKEQKTQNEDISTLKTQKEELEKEVQSLKEDAKLNSLTEDNSGELLHIENSTGARFNSLEIEGNEKQENQDGTSNLLVLEEGSKSQNGVAVTVENGEVTISGTATANTQLIIGKAYLHEGETYYIEKHGTSSNCGFRLQNQKKGAQQHWFATSGEVSFVAETTGEYDLYISTSSGQTPSATNLKLRVSKESGIEWEQGFINTPSFDYPSEIEAVGDNINLFDKNSITADKYINGKLTNTTNAYGDLVNSTATNTSDFMQVLKDKNYIFHFDYENLVATNARGYCFYNKEKQLIESDVETTYNPKNKEFHVTAEQDGYIRISYDKNCTKIKFEQGEKATAYSGYDQRSISLKIVNKNFLDIQKNASITKNGMTFKTDEDGVLTVNGTSTADIYLQLNKKNLANNTSMNFDKSMFRKGNYVFSVENLSNTKNINMSAYVRETVASSNIAALFWFLNNKKQSKLFSIKNDVNAVVYLWIANGITLNNAKIKFQIELADTATDIVANEEQNYIIPVQQRMFSGDKFVKVDGIWKEMHTMGTVYSKDVSNIVVSGGAVSGVEGFYRYNVNLQIANRKGSSYIRLYSNYFKYGDSRWDNKEGICGWENGQSFSLGTYNKNYDTADKLKKFLTENNVEFDYELKEPLYLDCTDEQIAVLDKIEQEAHTYSKVTNIYTEDEVGAVLKTNTAVDLKTVINNIQEQLIAE